MDREVRPQDDLFGYVNGGWVARTQIPSDRALHGTFRILADDAEQHLRAIVEEAAASDAAPGTPARKVGDLYAAFLDEARIRELGLDPVRERPRPGPRRPGSQRPAAPARQPAAPWASRARSSSTS